MQIKTEQEGSIDAARLMTPTNYAKAAGVSYGTANYRALRGLVETVFIDGVQFFLIPEDGIDTKKRKAGRKKMDR